MSTEFESFVRPFQTNDVTPSQTYYQPGQIGVPNIILRIGRNGSGKVFTGSYTANRTNYMSKHVVEKRAFIPLKPGEVRDYNQFYGKFGQGTVGNPMGGK